jgi:broad specificity phosphatase PhoE
MRLLLIRHGQTPANVLGALDTAHPGPGLTTLGHAQAAGVPAGLEGVELDGVFASTLQRTQLTGAPLAADRGLELRVLDGVHEIEAGEVEMATDHDSYRIYLDVCRAWGLGDRERRMPGATTGYEFFHRFDSSIAQIEGLETAAVFSHGAAIRVWVAASARNIEPIFPAQQDLDNTGMVLLEGSPSDGWELVEWRGEPLGGDVLADARAEDPTGESMDEALA